MRLIWLSWVENSNKSRHYLVKIIRNKHLYKDNLLKVKKEQKKSPIWGHILDHRNLLTKEIYWVDRMEDKLNFGQTIGLEMNRSLIMLILRQQRIQILKKWFAIILGTTKPGTLGYSLKLTCRHCKANNVHPSANFRYLGHNDAENQSRRKLLP